MNRDDGKENKVKQVFWKKKKEERSSEEDRAQTQEELQELKQQWKVFFRTGILVLAAAIALIIACIAWFAGNDRVQGTGMSIRSSGSDFDLAAAGTDAQSSRGSYDSLLDAEAGAETELGGKKLLSTDGAHTSITWAITADSHMENHKTDGGLEPGASGSLTFYILPHKNGPLRVTLDLALTGYKGPETAAASENITKADDAAQQLLEGHLLLFAGHDPASNTYTDWISADAETWSMDSGEGGNVSLSRKEDGKLVWEATDAQEDTAYPVTIYWIWPELLESYLMKADTYTGKRPLLFPDAEDELLGQLFSKMCGSGNASSPNRYFRWEDADTFKKTVAGDVLLQLRNNFNPVIYENVAAYYNLADEYLGENIRYVKLKVDAE